MTQNSYRYFKNDQCKYYPCHKIEEGQDFNCLFCYCPLNQYEDCPGNPRIIERESGKAVPGPGNFVTKDGRILGQHKGLYELYISAYSGKL